MTPLNSSLLDGMNAGSADVAGFVLEKDRLDRCRVVV
jgi:hypothetical protein